MRKKTQMPVLPLLFDIVLEVPVRQEKEIKSTQIGKKEAKLSSFTKITDDLIRRKP